MTVMSRIKRRKAS